uniref:Pyruvate kinase n=1 Tax=Glossina palpalis gambiensis TaxID=67801 RepID=A0A1B0C1R0_9MUSC
MNQVRQISHKLGKNIAILGDLQGPKIRISTFRKGKTFLSSGKQFILDASLTKDFGTNESVGIDYKKLPQDVSPGDILLLDDGRIQLEVTKIINQKIYTKVCIGGYLCNNKGINKLGGGLSAKTLTKKDKQDIIYATKMGVDYLAVSFPRTGEDLQYAKNLLKNLNSHAKIISKIERAEAVANNEIIDEIIVASDAIMVARGDLGVEIGDPELVGIQKKLIQRARNLNRAVITATQMMESMINNPMPTRAEVMDVANAVLDGTDAVMLSAETAIGKYPIETVISMANVCIGAEKISNINIPRYREDIRFKSVEEAIAMSAMYVANQLKGIRAIVSLTESGKTPLIMSRISSGLPIFALSKHEYTLNLTSLYKGVTPVYFNNNEKSVNVANSAINLLESKGFLTKGDFVVITQGDIMGTIGKTNTSRILCV